MSHSRLSVNSDDGVDLEYCPKCGDSGLEDGELRGRRESFRWQFCGCGWQSEMRGYKLIKYPWGTAYQFDSTLMPDVVLFQKLRGKYRVDPNAFRFSESFRQLVWKGTVYRLTANQTAIIKVLYKQHLDGTPDIHIRKLMSSAGIPTSSPRDSFQKRNHQLWGGLIFHKIGSPQGTLRLNL
jgi:hypothetical protein